MSAFFDHLTEAAGSVWQHAVSGAVGGWASFAIGFGLFAIGVVALLVRLNRRPKTLGERLDAIDLGFDDAEQAGGLFAALAPALAAQIPESKKERHDFQKLLRGAGMYRPDAATSIYALRFVLLFAPLVATGALILMSEKAATVPLLVGGVLLAVGLSITPRLYVYWRRRERGRAIRNGLPDTMDMLSMCLGGGMALSPSLDHVARQLNAYPELAEELLILKRQAEVGSLPQALADFSARVDLPEVRQLAGLLTRGERLGTQLAGTLVEHSDHLRSSRKQLATLQANKTPVKLVLPLMFCFAPAALILLIAPALVELKEFVSPSKGAGADVRRASLNTQSIFSTLDQLDLDRSEAAAAGFSTPRAKTER
ncbi:MAG TPA: type II secretion system F family protein [Pirellulales bacterium]|jgi:tight adherence protein C|nr:type II secretion system F family protein [Pirellulales bacterium]